MLVVVQVLEKYLEQNGTYFSIYFFVLPDKAEELINEDFICNRIDVSVKTSESSSVSCEEWSSLICLFS